MTIVAKAPTEEAVIKDEQGKELLRKKVRLFQKLKESGEVLSPLMEGLICGPVFVLV